MGEFEWVTKTMLEAYDAATKLAEMEGMNHRDAFAEVSKQLEQCITIAWKEGKIKKLDEEIKEKKIQFGLLEAIIKGKLGQG